MLKLRKSEDRGHADHGWLNSFHSFSFADYYDPGFMGFRVLRVINDDKISGGRGFPTHPHRDMEIITYVVEGALAHQDTLGTKSVILPGEVQTMSAGTGIQHSEFNHSKDQTTRLLQIWIMTNQQGAKPSYGQKSFAPELEKNSLVLVVSPDGRAGSLAIHQDVDLFAAKWATPRQETFEFRSQARYGWIQVVNGSLQVAGEKLSAGDGLAVSGEKSLRIEGHEPVEFLLFDLP